MPALQALPTEPNLRLAEMLEDLAREAREGKLIGVVALLNYTTNTASVNGGHWQRMEALYTFEMWKHRLLHQDKPEL